jgi:hypothetical protein
VDVLFGQCDGIRCLRLADFDFGNDPSAISQIMKYGFSRLMQFDAIECRGDIRMFVEHTPIPNLQILHYESSRDAAEDEEIISALVSKYQFLVDVHIIAKFESSAPLLKAVKCCRDLKSIEIDNEGGELMFDRTDILAIASLPRLEIQKFYKCDMDEDSYSALARCEGLNTLWIHSLTDPAVLSAIVRDLVNLDLWGPSKKVVNGIGESCPNLRNLELDVVEFDDEKELFVGSIKSGLKKLAKFKLNNEPIRLGTDWEGYE